MSVENGIWWYVSSMWYYHLWPRLTLCTACVVDVLIEANENCSTADEVIRLVLDKLLDGVDKYDFCCELDDVSAFDRLKESVCV